MSMEIKVPLLPESVADAVIATWHKAEGDAVAEGDIIAELETDKVMLEVPATCSGVMTKIIKGEGETVKAEELIATMEEGAAAQPKPQQSTTAATHKDSAPSSPSTRKMMEAHQVDSGAVEGSGKQGRITKEDVAAHVAQQNQAASSASVKETVLPQAQGMRHTERVPMTRMRATIAKRLLESQQSTASLTTFNEVDLTEVMALRKQYKEVFEKKHGIKLGFMSFFTKACCAALKQFPEVNAAIDGTEVVYHNYCDIGVAVSTDKGLVVPVVRNAESLGMHEIELAIAGYAQKARAGKITMDEMTGGTFSITNGGTFGSMLSTPILNIPQSAILGMHNIIQRPMVVNGEICIRPMMYLALTYDHRIIDGSQSVRFLVAVKQFLEDPSRLLLDI
jgi:2-oxoglutarate dehydrogenase E2 component (dihydrolipoamide succinyltransferase)